MRNHVRIQRLHGAAHRAHQAYLDRLAPEEFLQYTRNMLAGQNRKEVAARMRQYGYTESMVENGLKQIFAPYPERDRLPGKPR